MLAGTAASCQMAAVHVAVAVLHAPSGISCVSRHLLDMCSLCLPRCKHPCNAQTQFSTLLPLTTARSLIKKAWRHPDAERCVLWAGLAQRRCLPTTSRLVQLHCCHSGRGWNPVCCPLSCAEFESASASCPPALPPGRLAHPTLHAPRRKPSQRVCMLRSLSLQPVRGGGNFTLPGRHPAIASACFNHFLSILALQPVRGGGGCGRGAAAHRGVRPRQVHP